MNLRNWGRMYMRWNVQGCTLSLLADCFNMNASRPPKISMTQNVCRISLTKMFSSKIFYFQIKSFGLRTGKLHYVLS